MLSKIKSFPNGKLLLYKTSSLLFAYTLMFDNNEIIFNVMNPAFTAEDRDVRRTTSLITMVIRKTTISIHRKKTSGTEPNVIKLR